MHTPSNPPQIEPSTHTQPSVASPSARPRRPRFALRHAVPAFLLACSSVIIGGSLVGLGGCGAAGERPAVRVGRVASAHSRAATRLASAGSVGVDPSRPTLDRPAPGSPPSAGSTAASTAARSGADASAQSVSPSGRAATPPVAAAQRPTSDRPLDLDAPLRIKRLVVARDVEAREPVDPAERFKAADGDRIFAFVEVDNPERAESEIVVTFEPVNGDATGHVRLRVGASPRWRTWAFTRAAKTPGAWEAVVRNANGEVLARSPFAIES